jgi:hypothetical protein
MHEHQVKFTLWLNQTQGKHTPNPKELERLVTQNQDLGTLQDSDHDDIAGYLHDAYKSKYKSFKKKVTVLVAPD